MAGFEDDAPLETPAPKGRPGKRTEATPTEPATHAETASVETPAPAEAESFVALLPDQPIDVLKDKAKRDALYDTIGKEIAAQVVDLSTQAGRDRVKSFVYKITRTRTALDAAGKASTAELRKTIEGVNDLRNSAETALKMLEVMARKPLTDWETAEAAKAQRRGEISGLLQRALNISHHHVTPDDLKDLQTEIEALELAPDLWGEDLPAMLERKSEVIAALDDKIELAEARAKKVADDAAEWTRQQAQREIESQGQGDPNAPAVAPVFDQQETLPPISGEGSPPAAPPAKQLTPIQQARRRVLPALQQLGVTEEIARALILAIEKGQVPGLTATYLEKQP